MLTISKFGTLPFAVLAIIILGELATLTIMTSIMTPTAFAQPTAQQQQQSSVEDDVQIVSSTPIETSIGSINIIGEVRNDSPEVVGTVQIVGSFYDSSGRLIDTSSTYADLSQLRPGEKSSFRLGITDESVGERMDNYTLSINSNPVFGEPKPAALRIEISEQRLNEYGWYDIVGEITNTGNRDTSLVEVIATFYDETGQLIESEFTFLTSAVPAGNSAPFKLTEFNGDRANDAESVKLTVESSDYVMIDPELEQQQQSVQGMSQQQNDTAMTATSPSQATTEPLSTDAATSDNNISGSAGNGIDPEVVNQLTARAISYAEQANTALQSNDTEGASRNLNSALNELENIQGNLTSSTSVSNSAGGTNGDSNNTSQQATTLPSTPSSRPQPQEQPSSSLSPFSQQLQSQQQQEQEEGPPQQQSLPQEQNEGGATVSIVEGSSALTTDAYAPNPIQVSVGGTVTWTNDDAQPHTATSGENATPDGDFDSGIMAPGATFEHTFTEAGEYPYFCLLHPNQVGTVSVS